MVTPSINIDPTDNGFLVTDNTDYSTQQIIGTYGFFNYGTGLPDTNTQYETTLILVGGETVFDDLVLIHTDGDANIHDAEVAYNHIVETVNEGEFAVRARLNKYNSTSFRVWRVEFYTFDNLKLNESVVVTSTLTPHITTVLTGLNEITFRNLIIINPNGSLEDIGGVAQEESILFNYSQYEIGDIITLTFCNSSIVYDIVNSDTDCIIPDLVNLINESTMADNYYTLEASGTADTLIIKQTNDGVPFSLTISYSDGALLTPFTQETTVPNTPSMTVPTLTSLDSYEYEETDRGGKYLVTLTIGSVCDNETTTVNYYSWVFDKKALDCCFNKKLLSDSCCSKKEEEILESSALRNVIYGVEIGERDNHDPEDIQKLIDYGWDNCEDCGCGGNCGDC